MATATKEQTTNKVKEAFRLWKKKSNDGKTTYFTGVSRTGCNLVAFYNGKKKNPNEPDLRIYGKTEDGITGHELVALWLKESKAGKKYLSGKLTDQEIYLTAFINESGNEKQPYLRVYLKSELDASKPTEPTPADFEKQAEPKAAVKKETKQAPKDLF